MRDSSKLSTCLWRTKSERDSLPELLRNQKYSTCLLGLSEMSGFNYLENITIPILHLHFFRSMMFQMTLSYIYSLSHSMLLEVVPDRQDKLLLLG